MRISNVSGRKKKKVVSVKHLKAKQRIHNLVVYFTKFPENIQLTLIRFFRSLSALQLTHFNLCACLAHHFIITSPGLI